MRQMDRKYDHSSRDFDQSGRGRWLLVLLITIIILSFLAVIIGSWKRWEGKPPVVSLNRDFKALGRNPVVSVLVQDPDTGLKRVTINLKQKDQVIPLVEQDYAGPGIMNFWKVGDRSSKTFDLGKSITEKIQDGPASLEISATDDSFRHLFRGNRTNIQHDFVFDTHPPRLEVLSGQHYINQGGSDCVVYRTSPDAEVSGVQVGSYFFPGYPAPGGDANTRFALFAFPYNENTNTIPKIVATDAAGNQATAGFWYKLFPKTFKSSIINVQDNFLNKVVPEILSETTEVRDQGDVLKSFIEINNKLRRINHATLKKLSEKSAPHFLWTGPFLQLSNSKVEASFADHRTYVYNGKEIDHQDHVGFDLSVVQHYPIEATNDGVVMYAAYFGIYGNSVLIDHGCGLISLYGHLSSIDVKAGDTVKKKQVIGHSGETGLAAGDHLHFAFFLHGVPVNPTEWWDDHWIQDHIRIRFEQKNP